MDTYKDFFLNINEFDEENISYVKPLLFYKVSKNLGIYYRKSIPKKKKQEIPKQKIIFQTPKMLVPWGVKEFDNNGKKNYQLGLSFSTMTNLYNEEEIKNFYNFIKKIDRINEETILDYRTAWGLPKSLKYKKTLQRINDDYPFHMNVNLLCDEKYGFLFNVYDETAKKSSINTINKRSIVSAIIELTDLRFSDTEFRSNWTLMQIRKYKPISPIHEFLMVNCLIRDPDNKEDIIKVQFIEQKPITQTTIITQPLQNMTLNAQPINDNTSVFLPPTSDQLMNAIQSLKKAATVEKKMETGRIIPNAPPPPSVKNKKKKHVPK
uniref:Uncharacterized protein n=1 Tax=viral metagenome TaxID=1070528 RepID=A0A6C0LTH9_9ZZZZ